MSQLFVYKHKQLLQATVMDIFHRCCSVNKMVLGFSEVHTGNLTGLNNSDSPCVSVSQRVRGGKQHLVAGCVVVLCGQEGRGEKKEGWRPSSKCYLRPLHHVLLQRDLKLSCGVSNHLMCFGVDLIKSSLFCFFYGSVCSTGPASCRGQ